MDQAPSNTDLAARINGITERIIGCAFTVGNTLGSGFLEKVYENALAHELRKAGLKVEQQRRLVVVYDGVIVGEYIPDLVVEDLVPVELKAARGLDSGHEAQCINHLAATRMPVCLLLNFGSKVQVRRFVGASAPVFPNLGPSGSSVAMTPSEAAEIGDDP